MIKGGFNLEMGFLSLYCKDNMKGHIIDVSDNQDSDYHSVFICEYMYMCVCLCLSVLLCV